MLAHAVTLTGLQPGTRYYYRAVSRDPSGNLRNGTTYNFTTVAAPDTVPPVISAVSAGSITAGSASISWTTNEGATTQVEYGTTTAYGSTSSLDSSLVTAHSTTLAGLTSNTLYHYRVISRDAAGNQSTSADYTFTTAATDTTAPTISAVAASGLTQSGATVSWTTDEIASTQVEYGTTISYGSTTTLNSSLVTAHSANLSGLAAGTTYHYRVLSRDAAGNLATSGDYTFTTVAADTTPPTISAVAASGVTASGATVAWSTDEAANTQVEYGTTAAYGSTTTLNSALVTAHSAALSGLASGTTYHYRVLSRDAAGNLATSGDYTFTTVAVDTTPPTISAVTAINVSATLATVQWATNEGATSQVEYGTTTAYGTTSALDSALVTSHSVGLVGLAGSTTYHYRVISKDAAGNTATSGDYTFTTPAPPAFQPGVAVSFTFDDGHKTAYSAAYPVLAKYGFPGCVYVNTDYVGTSTESMSKADLTTLQNSGWEIGSHTSDHNMSEASIAEAKSWLDANGFPNSGFASPGGVWSHSWVNVVKKYHPYLRVADGAVAMQPYDQYRVSVRILDGASLTQVRAWLDEAQAKKEWVVFLSHQVGTGRPHHDGHARLGGRRGEGTQHPCLRASDGHQPDLPRRPYDLLLRLDDAVAGGDEMDRRLDGHSVHRMDQLLGPVAQHARCDGLHRRPGAGHRAVLQERDPQRHVQRDRRPHPLGYLRLPLLLLVRPCQPASAVVGRPTPCERLRGPDVRRVLPGDGDRDERYVLALHESWRRHVRHGLDVRLGVDQVDEVAKPCPCESYSSTKLRFRPTSGRGSKHARSPRPATP